MLVGFDFNKSGLQKSEDGWLKGEDACLVMIIHQLVYLISYQLARSWWALAKYVLHFALLCVALILLTRYFAEATCIFPATYYL